MLGLEYLHEKDVVHRDVKVREVKYEKIIGEGNYNNFNIYKCIRENHKNR